VSTTAPKRRLCSRRGCIEPSTTWAPVYGPCWSDDADEFVDGWGELPFCAEHVERAEAEALWLRLNALCGPFPRMLGWTLDTFPADDDAGAAALAVAREWRECWRDYGDLFVFGPVGSGKTGLAWSLAVDVQRANLWDDVRFVNVRQMLAEVRRSFATGERVDPTETLIGASLLVLDDLGAERVTDWTREMIATIVEGRYVAGRQTIVTSNYAPSELAQRLGHDDPVLGLRIVSRLTEEAMQVRLDRPDLRTRVARIA
jgi:DNA replication protein DnaC